MTGSRQTVLVEKGGIGRTPCFAPVAFDGAARAPAAFVPRHASPARDGTSI